MVSTLPVLLITVPPVSVLGRWGTILKDPTTLARSKNFSVFVFFPFPFMVCWNGKIHQITNSECHFLSMSYGDVVVCLSFVHRFLIMSIGSKALSLMVRIRQLLQMSETRHQRAIRQRSILKGTPNCFQWLDSNTGALGIIKSPFYYH